MILGLLVGGVLSGQSLIRAAELRSLTTDLQRYSAAINTFRDKYFAIPGDMNNASSFWSTCTSYPKNSCDGGGDGVITRNGSCSIANSMETFRVWQHLAYAGLVEGDYSMANLNCGIASNPQKYWPGQNVAQSRIKNVMYLYTQITGSSPEFQVSKPLPSNNDTSGGSFLTAAETWNIDKKFDDGLWETGMIHGDDYLVGNGGTCHTTSSGHYYYDLSNTDSYCYFHYLTQ